MADGYDDESPMKLIQSAFEISNEDLIKYGPKIVLDKADQVANEFIEQQSKAWVSKLDEITKVTGNIVDGEGKSLSPEVILKTLEKMHIDFREDGKPKLPSLVMRARLYVCLLRRARIDW